MKLSFEEVKDQKYVTSLKNSDTIQACGYLSPDQTGSRGSITITWVFSICLSSPPQDA